MTKLDRLYNALKAEFPQLAPYLYRSPEPGGTVCIGLQFEHAVDIKALIASDAFASFKSRVKACWDPAYLEPAHTFSKYSYKVDDVINELRPHVSDMLRMIQNIEKTVHPEETRSVLESLGFWNTSVDWSFITDENLKVSIVDPHQDTPSTFSWRLRLAHEGGAWFFDEYFDTLDNLLDFLSSGGRVSD